MSRATIALPRGACFDVEGLCPRCSTWLASPLVVEDAEWSGGRFSSLYRFVAWEHYEWKLRKLEYELRWSTGVVWGSLVHREIHEAFQRLGGDQGTPCLGSFETIEIVRPAHSGGAELKWGPKRTVELRRILEILVKES